MYSNPLLIGLGSIYSSLKYGMGLFQLYKNMIPYKALT